MAIAAALLLASCAETAVLELQIMVPAADPADPEPVFALVQVRRAGASPFDSDWSGTDVEAVELAPEPRRVQISVVTGAPDTDVHVKVRFCRAPGCDSIADATSPERWYALERPLYLGRRTAWATCIAEVPTGRPAAPESVDRGAIHGCIAGAALASYCTSGGAHICESTALDEPPRDLRCVGSVADY